MDLYLVERFDYLFDNLLNFSHLMSESLFVSSCRRNTSVVIQSSKCGRSLQANFRGLSVVHLLAEIYVIP